jgi:uncharacterized membrane protein YbhN (UPF0104 family)
MSKKNYAGKLIVALKIVVSLLFIYVLMVNFVDLSDFVISIREIKPVFMLFLILTPFTLVTRALRWQAVTKLDGQQVSFRDALLFYMVGIYYGSITPGKTGEFVRGYRYAKKYGLSKKSGFLSIILERLFDIIVPISFALYFLLTKNALIILLGSLVCTPFLWLASIWLLRFIKRFKFFKDLKIPKPTLNSHVLLASALSVLTWFIFAVIASLFLFSLDVSAPFSIILMAMALTVLAALIPITVNGWGLRESALIVLLLPYLDSTKIMIFSILFVFFTTYFIAIMGLFAEMLSLANSRKIL